jgi:type II secretory pathway component GspD/PulD (secretin)
VTSPLLVAASVISLSIVMLTVSSGCSSTPATPGATAVSTASPDPADEVVTEVMPLRVQHARWAVASLQTNMPHVEATADERTNSVIIRGTPTAVKAAHEHVIELDQWPPC